MHQARLIGRMRAECVHAERRAKRAPAAPCRAPSHFGVSAQGDGPIHSCKPWSADHPRNKPSLARRYFPSQVIMPACDCLEDACEVNFADGRAGACGEEGEAWEAPEGPAQWAWGNIAWSDRVMRTAPANERPPSGASWAPWSDARERSLAGRSPSPQFELVPFLSQTLSSLPTQPKHLLSRCFSRESSPLLLSCVLGPRVALRAVDGPHSFR